MKIQKFRLPVYAVLTMCLLALLMLALTACGSNSDQGSTTSSTPPKAQSTPTPTPASVATSTPGTPAGYCGSISRMMQGAKSLPGPGDPQKVGNCFWSAYQQCQPASISYITASIDTTLTRTFETRKTASGACQVQDTVQTRVIPRPPRTMGVYTCTSAKMRATSLQFLDCQKDGTITLSLEK